MEKLSRICWNTNNWKAPTGEARKYESAGSYVSENGFGHEEWLFNFQWLLPEFQGNSNKKYHYGNLQPFYKYWDSYKGEHFSARLYTISPEKEFLEVAKIHSIYVPEGEELEWAYQNFVSNGWLGMMKSDLDALSLDSTRLNVDHVNEFINIRFRQDDVEFFEPRRIVTSYFRPKNMLRYHPYNVTNEYLQVRSSLPISLQTEDSEKYELPTLRSEKARIRASIEAVEYEPRHYQLENQLLEWLKAKFGEGNVKYEENFVDLSSVYEGITTFYEIKIENTVKRCIRLAIGQLLEYSHYPDEVRADKLNVVGEGIPNDEDLLYLKKIRSLYQLPIYYARWNQETEELEEEV